ncbi:MAG: FixH family protein [Sulfurimicrobium sp.]|jgi:nitrogen fixation protein FixH|nr:FixH family protein [Sulfurimicrobium sp.]MDZ7656392.1 FixH family protein [Sulfurimicrobium sp.]
MFQTLFGGALLIIVLYYLLRVFGVSNYWRSVISGTFSVTAYLAYSVVKWPGGDVVSMHMAVFLATATVLAVIGARQPGLAKRLHWGPKLIIVFFLLLFVIDGGLLIIAGQGVPPSVANWLLPPVSNSEKPPHTAFSGVVPHGEESAKTINQFMKNAEKQRRLGWEVEISGLDDLSQQSHPTTLSVTAREAQTRPLQGATVKLIVTRPGLAQPEQQTTLLETDPGVYRGQVTLSLPGMWVVAVQLERGEDRFEMQQKIQVTSEQ